MQRREKVAFTRSEVMRGSERIPLAFARLELNEGRSPSITWVVSRCPFCGRRHTHGAGAFLADPRRRLGPRAVLCMGGGAQYQLIEEARNAAL